MGRAKLAGWALFMLVPVEASAGVVRGRLRFGEGPAAGVTVRAVPFESSLDRARREARRGPAPGPVATARTRADGAFEMSLPETAGLELRLEIEDGGTIPSALPGVLSGAELEDLGELAVAKAEPLAGRVVDKKGAPVAGAEVQIEPDPEDPRGRGLWFENELEPMSRRSVTGADGSFTLAAASPDGNELSVHAAGFSAARLPHVRAGVRPSAIVLAPGIRVLGRVTLPDGRTPAAGVLVHFEGRAATHKVETGADGSYSLDDVPVGPGRLVAEGGELGSAALSLEPGTPPPPLSLQPAARLEGRVVDAKSGVPVARARVEAQGHGGGAFGRSGADGRYRLPGLAPGSYRLRADEPRYAPCTRVDVLVLQGSARSVDLPVTPGATLSGRVVDEAGAPVAGAIGQVARGAESPFPLRRAARGAGRPAFRSGPDGRFTAKRLAPGTEQLLSVQHRDYVSTTVPGLALPPGGAKTDVTVVLRRGQSLTGVVRDGDGRPLADAEATLIANLFGRNGGRGFLPPGESRAARAVSGASGRFEFKGLSPGLYVLTVRKTGFADTSVDAVQLSEGSPARPLEIRLEAGASIAGIVRQTSGGGAAGFRVQARERERAEPRGPGLGRLAPTGPDGLFSIEGLRPGVTYTLQALGPQGAAASLHDVPAPAAGIELVVPGPGRIAGRVKDAASAAPVTDFAVSYEPDSTGGGRGFGGRVGRAGPGRGEEDLTHAADGSFVLEDVPAGTWAVGVRAPGYPPARVGNVVVRDGATTDGIEIRVARGATLTGRVIDGESGQGVPDASVSADSNGGIPAFGRPGGDDTSARTDADGRYAIEALAPGRYRVVARHPDYAEASQSVELRDAGEVELRLSGGGRVAGIVLGESRAAVPGASVVLAASDGGGRSPQFPGAPRTVTDAAGHFAFDRLSAGRYRVIASQQGRTTAPVDVVLQPGEAREDLALGFATGATIHGRVSGLAAPELAGVNVTATGPEAYSFSTRTAADGTFEVAGAPVGAIDFRARVGTPATGLRTATAQALVAAQAPEAAVEITFAGTFALSGVVRRAGAGLADVQLSASLAGQDGPPAALNQTDAGGAYRLEGLAEGRYVVAATPPRGSVRHQTAVLAGDTTLDFDLPPAQLAGLVVAAGSSESLAGAVVELSSGEAEDAARRGRLSATTDSNGQFHFADLDPGPYRATVRKTGFELEQQTLTAEEGESQPVVLELRRGEGLELRVRDGIFGVPLRALLVRVLDAAGSVVFSGAVALDSEGRGQIPSLKPGRYGMLVTAPGYATQSLPALSVPSPALELGMTPGGSLEVRAGPETLALKEPRAQILTAAGAPYPLSPFSMDGVLALSAPVRRVGNVAPGRYTLVVAGGESRSFLVTEGAASVLALP